MAQMFFYRPSSASVTFPGSLVVTQGTSPWIVSDPAAETSLASIDSNTPVGGALTDTQLRATPVPVSIASGLANPLPVHDAAFSDKTAAGLVTVPYDEYVIAYVGATTDIASVTYKLASSTVATLTMTYDGSNRLVDLVKT